MSQSNPFADMMEQMNQAMKQMTNMSMPNMNMDTLMSSGQANLDALTEANRIAMEGMQALAQRAQQMATEAVTDFQESAKSMTDMQGTSALSKPAELVRENFEKSVRNLRELAEIAGKSQTEAWSILGKRWQDTLGGKGSK